MTRVAAIAVALVVVAAVAVLAVAREEEQPYLVRAIFDNAGFIIEGEDVKVAGVRVGSIKALDVTDDFRAAIVLEIEEPGFQDFRADARCRVRPQGLIGERFVECEPTQARAAGQPAAPKLERIEEGPGKGQYLLPVERTEKTVDLDLVNNVMRLPYRQRLSIILNDLGGAVAGRGEDIDDVIRRSYPALRATNEVLELLGRQSDTLAQLAEDSDTVLAPLARERTAVSSFLGNAADVAQATAERRQDLEEDLRLLPPFLRELRPTLDRLGALSDQMRPVLSDLRAGAPDINRVIRELGPFAEASTPALRSLGEATDVGRPAVRALRPVLRDTRDLARTARPLGATAARLLDSFRDNRGIEGVMDYIFFQVAAINGFDSFGHYLRAGLLVNTCSTYSTEPIAGCSANFLPEEGSAASTSSSGKPRDEVLARTRAVLNGAKPEDVLSAEQLEEAERAKRAREEKAAEDKRRDAGRSPEPQPTATPAPRRDGGQAGGGEPLLEFLFGRDAG